ncbi:molecular chaperone [Metakosakonia massiliensis]|uniref:Chaperone protein EcpD n=1 Tax=Phytobacter massiliensis TaxID=1485952 RepID=A0A6N3HIH0_9ENTR|nr:molecular chaperone [Phytobacter massiliensis]
MKKKHLIWLLSFLMAPPLHAGIMPAGTRVIYHAENRERSLMLANTNTYPVIVQSWIDKGEGNPDAADAPFVVLPAVFRLLPGARQGLRIIYNGDPLPQDRESVFWINLYEIPPVTKNSAAPAHLTVAMNTQLKLFWRPKAITLTPEEAVEKLAFRLVADGTRWEVECDNPTPLNISFSSITLLNGKAERNVTAQTDMMTPAFSKRRYPIDLHSVSPAAQQVRFHYLNDEGGMLARTTPLRR